MALDLSRDEIIARVGYHDHERDGSLLHFETLQTLQTRDLPDSSKHLWLTSEHASLGSFERLPAEILDVIFDKLGFKELRAFRSVNRRAARLVSSVPMNVIATSSPWLLYFLFDLDSHPDYGTLPPSDFFPTLRSPMCAGCGAFGPFLVFSADGNLCDQLAEPSGRERSMGRVCWNCRVAFKNERAWPNFCNYRYDEDTFYVGTGGDIPFPWWNVAEHKIETGLQCRGCSSAYHTWMLNSPSHANNLLGDTWEDVAKDPKKEVLRRQYRTTRYDLERRRQTAYSEKDFPEHVKQCEFARQLLQDNSKP